MSIGARKLLGSELDPKYKAGLLLVGVGAVLADAYYNPVPYSEILQVAARENSVTASTYRDIAAPYNTECSICLEAFVPEDQVLHTPCRHTFHPACVRGRGLGECPNCRTTLNPPLN
jgi:hypothetical protein